MTTTNIPTAEQLENIEPNKDITVKREDDEGVSLEIYILEEGAKKTSARTYTRTFGHYFISSDSKSAEILDEIITQYTAENGIISDFNRNRHNSYELIFEVNDILSGSNEFEQHNKANISFSSQSKYIDNVDELISEISSEIKD